MIFLRFLEILIPILFALFIVFQLVVPVLRGTPILPILRHNNPVPDLLNELESVHQELDAETLTNVVEEAKQEVQAVRRKRRTVPPKSN